jgi:hypothetical protein
LSGILLTKVVFSWFDSYSKEEASTFEAMGEEREEAGEIEGQDLQ